MAEKWADYLISAVHYNAAGTHIDKVKSHVDNGTSVGTAADVERQTVVALLDAGTTYTTITESNDGKWQKGTPVNVINVDGTRYIKTIADSTKKDNLGNLPRF